MLAALRESEPVSWIPAMDCWLVTGHDLTREGTRHDATWLKQWIADPESVDPAANMPSFEGRLTDAQLTAIANYLAGRK